MASVWTMPGLGIRFAAVRALVWEGFPRCGGARSSPHALVARDTSLKPQASCLVVTSATLGLQVVL